MRMLFVATVIIAVGAAAISVAIAWVNRATSLMLPNAVQTKAELLRRIPISSPIETAKKIMTSNDSKCGTMRSTCYADFANPLNKQVSRGPANILYCDSGERSIGSIFVTKRWQVSFEDVDGGVSYIAVGVGLTGP